MAFGFSGFISNSVNRKIANNIFRKEKRFLSQHPEDFTKFKDTPEIEGNASSIVDTTISETILQDLDRERKFSIIYTIICILIITLVLYMLFRW